MIPEIPEKDPTTAYGLLEHLFNTKDPLKLIALASVAFIGWLLYAVIMPMATELHDHVTFSNWYQRQSCVNLSVLAGAPTELCNPVRAEKDK